MRTEIYGHCLFSRSFNAFHLQSYRRRNLRVFFLNGASYVFHSLIKSTLLAGKDLLCLDNKQNNTWSLVDSEFLFSCSTRRLTSKRSELSANSSDIELNIMGFLQVSKPWSSSSSYLNVLSTGAFLLPLRLIFVLFSFLSFFFFGKMYLKYSSFISPSLSQQLRGNLKTEIERKNQAAHFCFPADAHLDR